MVGRYHWWNRWRAHHRHIRVFGKELRFCEDRDVLLLRRAVLASLGNFATVFQDVPHDEEVGLARNSTRYLASTFFDVFFDIFTGRALESTGHGDFQFVEVETLTGFIGRFWLWLLLCFRGRLRGSWFDRDFLVLRLNSSDNLLLGQTVIAHG